MFRDNPGRLEPNALEAFQYPSICFNWVLLERRRSEVTGGGPDTHMGFDWIHAATDTKDGINGPFTIPGGVYQPNVGDPDYVHGIYGYRMAGPSSWHPGGCHFVLADGSVQFVTEIISPTIMAALTTRTGEEAFHYAF